MSFVSKLPFIGSGHRAPVVAVVRLVGPIGMPMALGRSLTLSGLAASLTQAFEMKRLKAVALAINSPGGSPVQSMLIHNRIRALAKEHSVPVFAFAEDVAASGGYMLALAADEIYSDPSSIIGSIGVVSAGFGFDKLIEKIGVERRLYTAGTSKAILDAFQPEKPEEVEKLKSIQSDIHDTFKTLVTDRRKDLKEGEDDLFSGAFWTGRQAVDLGLIDGIGDLRTIMRQRYGDEVRLKVISGSQPFWTRRRGSADVSAFTPASFPLVSTDDLLASLEIRSLWSRFGL